MQTILEQLEAMAATPENERTLVDLWNRFYSTASRKIRPNDEETINSDMRFFTPFRLMHMMQNGTWKPNDRWYIETSDMDDPNNTIRSFNDPREVIDLRALSEKIIHQKSVLDRAMSKVKSLTLPKHLALFTFA